MRATPPPGGDVATRVQVRRRCITLLEKLAVAALLTEEQTAAAAALLRPLAELDKYSQTRARAAALLSVISQ